MFLNRFLDLYTMKIQFSHQITLRVRYSETDQMGYCYYGNYAQYFEVGRVEALRSIGISYKELEENGVMLPVSAYSVEYKYPAKYDEVLKIITKITALNGARIHFDYQILNEEDRLVANASTTLVFVQRTTMRPIAPPSGFISLMQSYEISE